MAAAHEGNVFGVRPTKRHRRPCWGTAFHPAVPQVISVPKLFADHAALVGKVFDRFDERHRIACGSQFVMAALSRQNRPATTDARSIESTAVVLFPITIMMIATPPRT